MERNIDRTTWRKSTYSGDNGNCIEVTTLPDDIGVRDSADPDPERPVLRFGAEQWREFTETIK
jgi:hypothetical protein